MVYAVIKHYIKQYAAYFYVFNLLLNAINGISFTPKQLNISNDWNPIVVQWGHLTI